MVEQPTAAVSVQYIPVSMILYFDCGKTRDLKVPLDSRLEIATFFEMDDLVLGVV
jgi:hypothetical protein